VTILYGNVSVAGRGFFIRFLKVFCYFKENWYEITGKK